MRAGELKTLLTLEEPSETVTSGNATPLWTERGKAWAKMEFLGDGRARAAELNASSYRFTIRHRSDITSRWRLGISGGPRKFQIGAIGDPDNRRVMLIITATETLS